MADCSRLATSGADDASQEGRDEAATDASGASALVAWLVCKHVKSTRSCSVRRAYVASRRRSDEPRRFRADRDSQGRRSREGACWLTRSSFPDNVDTAPGGVIASCNPALARDADSIAACDEHGIAMMFTGRPFRH
jgi:phosphoribosylaminoimidazolecarboxamide formyltransferase/IMP cyclohydrolase